MLTGQNGILTQAQRAKNETEETQKEEQNILDSYENYLNDVTGDVSQVDDSNPGVLEGSGTQQEPFIINSIEDLVVFADNVTKGSNTYQDQYVELGLSLDFNSDKSYVNPNSEDYAQYGYKLFHFLSAGLEGKAQTDGVNRLLCAHQRARFRVRFLVSGEREQVGCLQCNIGVFYRPLGPFQLLLGKPVPE